MDEHKHSWETLIVEDVGVVGKKCETCARYTPHYMIDWDPPVFGDETWLDKDRKSFYIYRPSLYKISDEEFEELYALHPKEYGQVTVRVRDTRVTRNRS